MSDTLKKVLLGAVLGAVLVAFAMHVREQRARRAPVAAGAPAPPAQPGSAGAANASPAGGGTNTAFSQAPLPVVAVPVRKARLTLEAEALGTAGANESVDVTAKVSNLITVVRFKEGQKVRRGQVLVELDGRQAQAELEVAEAALSESRSQFNRSRELYTTQALSEAQLEQIEATLKANEARVAFARSRLSDTVITAPFAGRVGLRRVSVGGLVNPGTVITTLDDTDTIKLDFTIPETLLSSVRAGLGIVAKSVAYPDEEFAGTVASVDSRVDPTTRSVTVRALMPNDRGLLKPGMFLTVRLARGTSDALLVPEQALVPEQGNVFVYVVKDDRVEKRQVRTGERRVGDVQILAGVAAGEQVVTEGTQKLRDGAPVTVQEPAPARASNSSEGQRS
jgi:membrane fusion protein, multidrug efflux system